MQADKANKLQREQDLCRVFTSEFHLPEEAVVRPIILSKAQPVAGEETVAPNEVLAIRPSLIIDAKRAWKEEHSVYRNPGPEVEFKSSPTSVERRIP